MKPLLTLHPLTKTCTMCKQNKPVEENFYKRYDHDSFYSKCKLCLNSIPRNPREAYFKKPKIKAKNKSRHALTYAVRVGKMVRQPCVKCGNKKTEGHHEDYSKPYDVIWLCRACHSKEHRMLRAKEKKMKLTILLLSLCLIGLSGSAYAEVSINLERIAQIESGYNPHVYNVKSGATGMYQITQDCLTDFNTLNSMHYRLKDMYDPQKGARVAEWYLNNRIPQLLRHYKLADTVDNRLWSYNAGVGALKRKIKPSETVAYIKKYHKLGE